MGVDLKGIKPRTDAGVCFHSNYWWWRPLADYVLPTCADIFLSGETKYWQSNDGQVVSAQTTQAIAARLKELLATGAVGRFASRYEAERKSTPKQRCSFCGGTGKRTDWPADISQSWIDKCHGCNACLGTGWVDDTASFYPFSADNVREFAEFCENCGGFEIW
jgi:hypothetical protein